MGMRIYRNSHRYPIILCDLRMSYHMPLAKQGSLYVFAGLLTCGVDFSFYNLLLALAMPADLCKGVSFILAIVVSFYLNRTLVFKYRGTDNRFERFLILAMTNLITNVGINKLSLVILGSERIHTCFIIATVVTVICSFLGQKFWVFRSCKSIVEGAN